MVNNPLWSRTLDEYRRDFAVWTHRPDEHAHMSVAIFYDADAVAGDPSLLRKAKTALVRGLADERAFMGRFARAVDAFDTPIGLFNNLKTSEGDGDALDLKKGGIFPIVHGVRALAIERGLEETNTLKRLARLAELDVLKTEFARDLTQSLNYLMTLRLDAQLAALASGSLLRPGGLSTLERDLLRDSFHVVKQLREIVRRHFNSGAFWCCRVGSNADFIRPRSATNPIVFCSSPAPKTRLCRLTARRRDWIAGATTLSPSRR